MCLLDGRGCRQIGASRGCCYGSGTHDLLALSPTQPLPYRESEPLLCCPSVTLHRAVLLDIVGPRCSHLTLHPPPPPNMLVHLPPQVLMEDGSIQTCSRDIAVIYYLTQGWRAEEGGHLIDLEAPAGEGGFDTVRQGRCWLLLRQYLASLPAPAAVGRVAGDPVVTCS
jgi:hypothetical protein